MPNYTETLKLIKPTEDEFYNIAVPNANMDALDAYVRELREQNQLLREELANKAGNGSQINYLPVEGLCTDAVSSVEYGTYGKNQVGIVEFAVPVMTLKSPVTTSYTEIMNLPEGFRPKSQSRIAPCLLFAPGTGHSKSLQGWMHIGNNGKVSVWKSEGAETTDVTMVAFQFSYIAQ